MKPYYTDPYTIDFEAETVEIFEKDDGVAVVLDKSYFYPTSGGQEHDTGSINEVGVKDVIESDGKTVHLLSGKINPGKVACKIDWKRRFENMEQHTGQHILSAAFGNFFDIQTVSSRLGEEIGTIDLSRQPSENEIDQSIAEANKVIQENRDVVIHFADNATIGSYKLRKQPKVEGTIRIVEVKDFDFSPCGGTHCTHTSEIGVILTGSVEKVKSSLTRIEFVCGNRAMRHYYALHSSATESGRLLSTASLDLPAAVEKLKSQLQENGSRIKELSERILAAVCERFKQKLDASTEVVSFFDLTSEVSSAEELRYVASCMSKKAAKSFGVFRNDDDTRQMNLNLTMNNSDSMINQLRTNYGVKGGGRNGFFSLSFDRSMSQIIIDKLTKAAQNV